LENWTLVPKLYIVADTGVNSARIVPVEAPVESYKASVGVVVAKEQNIPLITPQPDLIRAVVPLAASCPNKTIDPTDVSLILGVAIILMEGIREELRLLSLTPSSK
jgi:hypothetical protein